MYPIFQNFNMWITSTLYVQSANQFEMSSFIRSKDMAWALKCRNGLIVILTTPTWRIVRNHRTKTSRGKLVYEI